MKIKSPEKEAINYAKKILEKEYKTVKDVSKKGGDYRGYDFLCIDEFGNEIKIEVKGATRFHGIPDPYITEFDEENKEMRADYLYVFYFPRDEDEEKHGSEPIFYKIPKKAITPDNLEIKKGWRIKKFKKRMNDFKENFL